VLLREFLEQFFLCFFPAIDWLDKELFLAPPHGEKRQLDLVARLRLAAVGAEANSRPLHTLFGAGCLRARPFILSLCNISQVDLV
jgi:hypothetical protein